MAVHANSTTAPVVQTGLLPFVFRPSPSIDDSRSAVELLDEIRRTIEAQEATERSFAPSARPGFYDQIAKPELPHEPLLSARSEIRANDLSELAPHGGARGLPTMRLDISTRTDLGSADRCSMSTVCFTVAQTQHDVGFDLPGSGDLKAARTIHLRRQLVEAAEHGVALLDALGLPRLVTAEFEPIDRETVADALDVVISHLDAVDGDENLEPYLAGYYNGAVDPTCEGEADSDDEPSLGAPENHPGRFHVDMEGHHHVGRARHSLGDQSQWAAGGSWDNDAEAVNEEGDDLDHGEMQEGELEPWLGAPEGCQFHNSGDLDLEQDGEIERPWWAPSAAGFNHDGGRYA